ncbi:hypothetical protein Pan14r_23550 [Crateriforma conspicua]|uniref:Secreted protein n=2 Tax=Crateriforma conspicua TaxID=2527996 RepID=A0A5C5Y2Z8_9PLAN|nr:hypothetical protein Pan14r_23550 [Crateriforma conspicua]
MRWRCLLAVILGLSMTDVATFAQGRPEAERLSPTPSSLTSDMSFDDHGMARFILVGGRLQLHPLQHRKGRETRDRGGVFESISVQSHAGLPTLQYTFQSAECHLSLNVQDAKSIRMELFVTDTQRRDVLEQYEGKPVRWITDDTIEADSLLHLRRQNPQSFDKTFGEIVAHLLRGQSLHAFSRNVDRKLIHLVSSTDTALPRQDQIRQWIEALSADQIGKRQTAQNQLLRVGTPVLQMLDAIPSEHLDAEQRYRIKQIRRRLTPTMEDSVASWAHRLAMDRQYFATIAGDLPIDQQLIVNRHLESLGMEPIVGSSESLVHVATSSD